MNVIPWTMLATVRLIFRRGLTAFGWLRGGHISIAIVVAVLIGAVYALPFSFGSGSAPAPWRVPRGGPALIDGQNIPVFCLEGVAPAVRCGIAEAHADGQVGFREYGDAPPPARIPSRY